MSPSVGKLPDVGTTIFTVVSQRAQELGAINLAQGFPDYDVDPELIELISQQLRAGRNQYAPMAGVPELRREIAAKLQRSYSIEVDADREITITVGGTEALFSAIAACIGPGDEVIVFDPAYDSYDPAVRVVGGKCVHLALQPPAFRIPWAEVAPAITSRTRMIIVNNPHNPACTVFDRSDVEALAKLVQRHDLLVLADEVYEHVVLDGRAHHSVLSDPVLRARSFAVFSFGKTFHATGWRLGYCVAPPPLAAEFRKVHQFNTFAVFTPGQYAIAEYLRLRPQRPAELPAFFARKRDRFCSHLEGSRFSWEPAAGTYFQLLDYSRIADEDDVTFADTLIRNAGVAAIPLSPFYSRAHGEPPRLRLLRFCIAKRDETLEAGAQRLRSF